MANHAHEFREVASKSGPMARTHEPNSDSPKAPRPRSQSSFKAYLAPLRDQTAQTNLELS